MAKPRYNSTERMGVSAVSSIIDTEFKWIFREQSIADMGIDAHIEIVEEGVPKGIIFGVQIKSGESHFKIKQSSLVYYFNNTHYDYWTKHSLPVILIAYLPDNKHTYWQFLNKATIKKTKINWKIEIPLSQELNRTAIEPIWNYLKKLSNPTSKILEALNILDNISPNWRVGHHTSGNTVFFYPEPKHELADKKEPLTFRLTFPKDLVIDGIHIQDIVSNPSLIKKPIFFSKGMMNGIEACDFLKNAMNFGKNTEGIQIIPLKQVRNTVVKFIDYQANEFLLDNIIFFEENNLDGKTIVSNKNQNNPYHLTITAFHETNQISISISINRWGYSVNEILKGFKFLQATTKGGILTVIDKFTNNTILIQDSQPKPENVYVNEFIIVLELLNFIQFKLSLNFPLPDRNITDEEIFKIKKIGHLIRGNMLLCEDFQWWNIELDSKKTNEFLEEIDKFGSISYYQSYDDLEENLFETNVNLGHVHYFCDAVTINDEDKTDIAAQLSAKEENIKIILRPFNNSRIFHFYENYLENGKELSEEKIRKYLESFPYKYSELN